MRKIFTQEQRDKKIRRNRLIIGILLIGTMIFGTLGYAFSGRENQNSKKIEYKGIEFIQDNSEYWHFNIQGYEFITRHNPKEVENINFISYSSINNYMNKPLYIDSEFNEPNFEISRNLGQVVLRMQNACLLERDCRKDLPIKNCSLDNMIIIKSPDDETKKASIFQQENCIFITANPENQTIYADAFLFKTLGI